MSPRARKTALGLSAVLASAVLAAWPVGGASLDHLVIEPEVARWEVSPPEAAQVTQPARSAPTQLPPPRPSPAAQSGDEQPHPITPEREALQQELPIVDALQDALVLGDVPALRGLIERYRAHVPGDENKLAEGYARLADCLELGDATSERDGASVRAAARQYYENERASTLRGFVRRICLER